MSKKEVHSCLGCNRDTTAKCQICDRCTQMRRYKKDERGSAGSSGPETELFEECEHDYSENSLGPHTSDDRWDWYWVFDEYGELE